MIATIIIHLILDTHFTEKIQNFEPQKVFTNLIETRAKKKFLGHPQ